MRGGHHDRSWPGNCHPWTSGIGLAIAEALLADGWKLIWLISHRTCSNSARAGSTRCAPMPADAGRLMRPWRRRDRRWRWRANWRGEYPSQRDRAGPRRNSAGLGYVRWCDPRRLDQEGTATALRILGRNRVPLYSSWTTERRALSPGIFSTRWRFRLGWISARSEIAGERH